MTQPPRIDIDVPPDSTTMSAFAACLVEALQVALAAGVRRQDGEADALLAEIQRAVDARLDAAAAAHEGVPKGLQGVEIARDVIRQALVQAPLDARG